MRRGTAGAVLAVALVSAAALLPASASAARQGSFFGVVPQAPLGNGDLARIASSGLALRLVVPWSQVEPADGVFDFSETDRVIGGAARRGIAVLPQVGGIPPWLSADPAAAPLAPRASAAWSDFLRQLVRRYGPGGEPWNAEAGSVPVRRWQIWNEPNFPLYWRRPSPASYAKLLHASAAAIRGVDPGATIVAAAVAPITRTMRPWEYLRRLYRVPGVKHDFDVAALHPYAASWPGVAGLVKRVRRVMATAGDRRKPLLLTEIGVASGGEQTAANPGPLGQARFLDTTFSRLYANRHRWRIGGVYWYAWKDGTFVDDHCSFCEYAGLFDGEGRAKPSWFALKGVLARFAPGGFR